MEQEDAIGFSLNPKSNTPPPVIQNAPSPFDDRYKMNHKRRGLVIIFNHMNFNLPNCPKRVGTNKDRDDLENLFKKLKFNVKSYNDLKKEEVRQVLVSVSIENHTDNDCLIIIVLSHGDNRKIFAKDSYYPTDMLWYYFDGNHSQTLVGKPKLFFIQACRGENQDVGVKVKYTKTEIDSTSEHRNNDKTYNIPVMADILVMYSTVEDFLSWRNPSNGSYFIQSLIRQLTNNYNKKDLLTILTYVNREVATGFSLSSSKLDKEPIYGHKQMCSIVSMLTREIYF